MRLKIPINVQNLYQVVTGFSNFSNLLSEVCDQRGFQELQILEKETTDLNAKERDVIKSQVVIKVKIVNSIWITLLTGSTTFKLYSYCNISRVSLISPLLASDLLLKHILTLMHYGQS